jgi:ornithine cyclodeaminase/alanine dehydrogenase-like protein (mu-crystallin family)
VHVFTAPQTRERTPYDALIPALERAVTLLRRGAIVAPERLSLPLPEGGRYLVMPAVDERIAVTKIVTVHPRNPANGLPAIRGHVFVADARTGEALAALDGPTITSRRTAALSMLGIQKLHAGTIRRVAIVGSGVQAREHALAAHEVFGAEIVMTSLHLRHAEQACAQLSALGVNARPCGDPASALHDADVVIAATTSRIAVLPESLPDELLIVGVGAFTPEMVEVPRSLVLARRIVVDTLEGARHEAGDLIQANIDWSRVTPLADCLGADRPRRNVFFKTVGHAAWDLAAAAVALNLAC